VPSSFTWLAAAPLAEARKDLRVLGAGAHQRSLPELGWCAGLELGRGSRRTLGGGWRRAVRRCRPWVAIGGGRPALVAGDGTDI
jgi:hypothetical protein